MQKNATGIVWVMIAAAALIVICAIKFPQDHHVKQHYELGLKFNFERTAGFTNEIHTFDAEGKRNFDCLMYKSDPNWFIQWEMTNYANSLPNSIEMKIFDVTGLYCD